MEREKNQTTISGGAEKRQGRGGDLDEEEEEGWRLKSKHTWGKTRGKRLSSDMLLKNRIEKDNGRQPGQSERMRRIVRE